jgi:hypothetical protein
MYAALALDALAEKIAWRMVRRHLRIAAGDPNSRADLERPPTSTRFELTEGARMRDTRLETEAHPGQEVRHARTRDDRDLEAHR